jgi:hypothetical protein
MALFHGTLYPPPPNACSSWYRRTCNMTLILLLLDTNFLSQVAPGVCDGISGRCAIEAGFDCSEVCYTNCVSSGAAATAGFSASRDS